MTKGHVQKELLVGMFISLGIGLAMFIVVSLGATDSLFTRYNDYTLHFDHAQGLIEGSKVVLGGIRVGVVKGVEFDREGQNIRVKIKVKRENADWITESSTAEIATQGVLGDKFVEIKAGKPTEKPVPENSDIPVMKGSDLSQFISSGEELLASFKQITKNFDLLLSTFVAGNRSEIFFKGISDTAKNLSELTDKMNRDLQLVKLGNSIEALNSILHKIDSGKGTLGALVNDQELYNDARSLFGGVNRNRIMRNLIRKTIKETEDEELNIKKESESRH